MAMQEIVFGPDNTLYSLEEDGVYVWNDDKTEKRRLVSNNHFSSLVVGENDKLYVLGTTKETILIIDPYHSKPNVTGPYLKISPCHTIPHTTLHYHTP